MSFNQQGSYLLNDCAEEVGSETTKFHKTPFKDVTLLLASDALYQLKIDNI
jgi:hypothetical protein